MPIDPSSPSDPEKCPNCGAPLPEQAPQGLCPKCLFAGLAVPTDDGTGVAAQAPAQTPEELAPHFPQLEILECLGRGGMGVVYKARQKSLNRLVALKLLAPERVSDARFAERFTHEAQALAALNHPNIVTIHDFGQAGGFYFLLMEFVDGVNLRQAMKAGRFTPEQALAIVPVPPSVGTASPANRHFGQSPCGACSGKVTPQFGHFLGREGDEGSTGIPFTEESRRQSYTQCPFRLLARWCGVHA